MSAPHTAPFETLDALLRSRHSCRAFLSRPVPQDDINAIVRTAGRVPSWCNAQPWQVIVTGAEETDRFRVGLAAHMQENAPAPDLPFPPKYSGAHQERRRTCGFQLYDAVGIEKGDRAASGAQTLENFRFFGAPHVAIISSGAELGPYGALDCGAFVTAFTLAAEARGIGSVPQASVASFAPYLRAHFGIGEDRTILCAISFGYSDTGHPANSFRTERADLDDILEMRE